MGFCWILTRTFNGSHNGRKSMSSAPPTGPLKSQHQIKVTFSARRLSSVVYVICLSTCCLHFKAHFPLLHLGLMLQLNPAKGRKCMALVIYADTSMVAEEQLEDPLQDNSHHNTWLGDELCVFAQQFYIRKEIFMKCVGGFPSHSLPLPIRFPFPFASPSHSLPLPIRFPFPSHSLWPRRLFIFCTLWPSIYMYMQAENCST